MSARSFEVELARFSKALKAAVKTARHEEGGGGEKALVDFVQPSKEALVAAYIRESLEPYSNIKCNDDLVNQLVGIHDFSEFLDEKGSWNGYTVRRHVRSVIKMYLAETNKARAIKVTNTVQFELRLEAVGLNLGWAQTSHSPSVLPDGNIVVLAALTLALVYLVLRK
jgi:hypothetical protein